LLQTRLKFVYDLQKEERLCDESVPFSRPTIIPDVVTRQQSEQLTKDAGAMLQQSQIMGANVDSTVRKSETGYCLIIPINCNIGMIELIYIF
jgi:hypothetical protein